MVTLVIEVLVAPYTSRAGMEVAPCPSTTGNGGKTIHMDINKFTEKAQEALQAAQKLAVRFNNQQIDVEHLLVALLDQEKGLAPAILSKAGVSLDSVMVRAQREIEKLPRVTGSGGAPDHFYLTGRMQKLLGNAEDEAKKLKDDFVSIEHLLLALTDDRGAAGDI